MTRINLVAPSELTDKHLLAEYRELPRIFTAVKKHIEAGRSVGDFNIPEKYCLGKGHVTFFYNKVFWLRHRYQDLITEMIEREFNIDELLVSQIMFGSQVLVNAEKNTEWGGDFWWSPTPDEVYLNMSRLVERHYGQ